MKGFKKDGKFRPTERKTKSALKKSDVGRQEIRTKKYIPMELRTKQEMDEDVIEGRVEDIFDHVADAETGKVHHQLLDKSAHDNIEYILERDHFLEKGDIVEQYITDYQEETGTKEFEKTGEGQTGYYLSSFTVRRNHQTIYKGIAEGDIVMGNLQDMELQMRKV